ncbi:hypothetical protein PG993_009705 [Apiospora rasikravindrae]|uniref:Uncharacterized protein n=1 Tax=Apiospora rasikravindrae TaxID=990691 RepID=A0ABR1SK59_9PEZI
MISFDPVVEVINLPNKDPNRRRRRRQSTLEVVPPRAPEIERLSTPDFDPPPSLVQSFCSCCINSKAPKHYPGSRQSKLEAQIMEAKAYIARTSQQPRRIEYPSDDFVLFP